ncbi:hypothetical protein CTA2_7857 [Colletotrichum tanaceti]|nr:hypothetical protein CTA2_7857 [Colletotrichum tanaceti]
MSHPFSCLSIHLHAVVQRRPTASTSTVVLIHYSRLEGTRDKFAPPPLFLFCASVASFPLSGRSSIFFSLPLSAIFDSKAHVQQPLGVGVTVRIPTYPFLSDPLCKSPYSHPPSFNGDSRLRRHRSRMVRSGRGQDSPQAPSPKLAGPLRASLVRRRSMGRASSLPGAEEQQHARHLRVPRLPHGPRDLWRPARPAHPRPGPARLPDQVRRDLWHPGQDSLPPQDPLGRAPDQRRLAADGSHRQGRRRGPGPRKEARRRNRPHLRGLPAQL